MFPSRYSSDPGASLGHVQHQVGEHGAANQKAHLTHVHMLTASPPSTGMRILVTLLLDTLPMLGNVLLLCFFVFFIFGIVGVQLWAGLLRNRCFLDSTFVRCAALPLCVGHAPSHLPLGYHLPGSFRPSPPCKASALQTIPPEAFCQMTSP